MLKRPAADIYILFKFTKRFFLFNCVCLLNLNCRFFCKIKIEIIHVLIDTKFYLKKL